MPSRTVFFDRDGVINKKAPPHQYICSWEEFEFLPHVAEAIKDLNRRGFLVVIISNQRGVARGMLSVEKLDEIHARMLKELHDQGAVIDGIYYCPHNYEDNCDCRKPKPGMLLEAAKDLDIDLSESFMVGDSEDDIAAGKAAGCKTVLVSPPDSHDSSFVIHNSDPASKPDRAIPNLGELATCL